jgi:hypothetical protein
MYHDWQRSEMSTKILAGNSERQRQLGRTIHEWKDDIKTYLRRKSSESVFMYFCGLSIKIC